MRYLAALTFAVVLALGFAAGSAGAKPPKARKATIAQVASVVAENRRSVEEAIVTFQSTCQPTITCSFAGKINALTVGLAAKTLVIYLDGIDNRNPNNKGYVGTVPKKIRRLYNNTLDAAKDVAAKEPTFTSCAKASLDDPATGSCGPTLSALYFSTSTLRRQLDAWDAYL